ncbi:MAG TPA: hypothetical protein VLG71_03645, partial [Candidatus Limnocylindria bacterium]|nr:hypothetical protein [Candidatus Limnocylindria bacterium]
FLTLNPLVHIDWFGFLVLVLFSVPEQFSGFGWGKHVPINPHNIQGPRRWLKLCCAFFSDSLAYFVMAACAMTGVALAFGLQPAVLSVSSSFSMVIVQLMIAFVRLSIYLILIESAINAVILIALYFTEDAVHTTPYIYYVTVFAPLIILLLFGNQLYSWVAGAIWFIQQTVAPLAGV